jgi:hypothetical protein
MTQSNLIHITECDNQLLIYAVKHVVTPIAGVQLLFPLANVGSGPAVDIQISLEEGNFVQPNPILNSAGKTNLTVKETVKLPAGKYSIYYSGFNTGGPYNFKFSLNNTPYQLKNGQGTENFGFIWNRASQVEGDIIVNIG